MRTFSFLSLIVVSLSLRVFSQEKWIIDIDANVTLTQSFYTDNWTGGERGAVSWASKLNTIAEKQVAKWFNHKNTLKLAFGQTAIQDKDKNWLKPEKSTDLIDFESLQRLTVDTWVDPYISVRLISQFFDKSDTLKYRYFNPLDITESFGVSRGIVNKNKTLWTARLGGAVHQRIDRDRLDEVTLKRETDVTNDAGVELITEFKTSVKEGFLDFTSNLRLYEALISSVKSDVAGTAQENDWRYPDVTWENILSINLTKFIMINLTTQLLYDREIDRDVRFKEVLAVGLNFKFNNAAKKE